MWCPLFVNGALVALICGALGILLYSVYSSKMNTVVPLWCPNILKTYKKLWKAVKRYSRYSSRSLLFSLVFFPCRRRLVSSLRRLSVGVVPCGKRQGRIFYIRGTRQLTVVPLLLQGWLRYRATFRYLSTYALRSHRRYKSRPWVGVFWSPPYATNRENEYATFQGAV